MPLGQTILHFPQTIHPFIRESASVSKPLSIKRIALRRLVSVILPALQEATQDPQPIHLDISGDRVKIVVCNGEGIRSRSILLLGVNLYPKSIICF